ncbi:MAG: bacteriohemerythrin [Gammaproteobacteria bacterium]
MNDQSEAIESYEITLTGIDIIDQQHQIFANMINSAQARLTENSPRPEIETVIRDLMSYALYHFETEEELMLIHRYDVSETKKHCEEHRSFSATIAQFQKDIRLGKLISSDELLGYANQWLRSHTMNTDLKLGRYLRSIE